MGVIRREQNIIEQGYSVTVVNRKIHATFPHDLSQKNKWGCLHE